jgi:hypothetical protein
MIGMLTSGTIFVSNMIARTEILQKNQEFIATTQQKVLGRLDNNDVWKSDRVKADTLLAVNMKWMYDKIIVHEARLNRLDLAHKLYPIEYGKQ